MEPIIIKPTKVTKKRKAKKASGPSKPHLQPTSLRIEGRTRLNIYKDSAGEWRWNLKAGNGSIVADSSEGYKTKWGCKRAARRALGL